MSDLIDLNGETDGSSTSGTFSLQSEWFENTVDYIKIDKGLAAKLWIMEISGAATDVIVQQSFDGGSSWSNVKRYNLTSDGHLELDNRRPIIMTGMQDDIQFRLQWSQDTAAKSYVNATVEFDEAR